MLSKRSEKYRKASESEIGLCACMNQDCDFIYFFNGNLLTVAQSQICPNNVHYCLYKTKGYMNSYLLQTKILHLKQKFINSPKHLMEFKKGKKKSLTW